MEKVTDETQEAKSKDVNILRVRQPVYIWPFS